VGILAAMCTADTRCDLARQGTRDMLKIRVDGALREPGLEFVSTPMIRRHNGRHDAVRP